MRGILALALVPVAFACGAEQAGAPGGGGGGGGGVGFGGAQDIGQFRALLDEGLVPGPSTLDANGFFSEHRTELPPPDCGQTLCANGMLSVGRAWVGGDYQATLQVALNTPVDPTTLERKPLNMVVVVDNSGSMIAENRLGFVKQGLHLLIDELEPGDNLAVVTYADRAQLRVGLGDGADAETLRALVDSMIADGSTNIYEGLEVGMDEAQAHFDLERQNRVVLLSDGLATSGIIDDNEILNLATSYIQEGIGLTTIGVGLDFNVELMRGLSERGAGNFYFIETPEAAVEVFTEELDYFVSPLALSVALEVEVADGYRLGDAHGTRLWKPNVDSGTVLLPAVFVASRVDDTNPNGRRGGGSALFIELIPERGLVGPGPVASIRLSYTLPGETERREQTITVNNPNAPGELSEDLYVSQAAMVEHYAVYNMFLGLHDAARHADADDYNCAVATLRDVREDAIAWNQEFADSDVGDDIELVDQFIANLISAGAQSNPPLEGCDTLGPGSDHYEPHACSAAGGSGGSSGLIIALALGLATLGRRRYSRRHERRATRLRYRS